MNRILTAALIIALAALPSASAIIWFENIAGSGALAYDYDGNYTANVTSADGALHKNMKDNRYLFIGSKMVDTTDDTVEWTSAYTWDYAVYDSDTDALYTQFGSTNKITVRRIDITDGTVDWTTELTSDTNGVERGIDVDGSHVYVLSSRSTNTADRIWELSKATGTESKTSGFGSYSRKQLITYDGYAYKAETSASGTCTIRRVQLSNFSNQACAVDDAGNGNSVDFAVSEDSIYVANPGTDIRKYDRSSGTRAWISASANWEDALGYGADGQIWWIGRRVYSLTDDLGNVTYHASAQSNMGYDGQTLVFQSITPPNMNASSITFQNDSYGHSFTATATASHIDSASNITSYNATATNGSCTFVETTTISNNRTVTYRCNGTAYIEPTITITFTDNANQTATSTGTNAYPNALPNATFIFAQNADSHTVNITSFASDADGASDIVSWTVTPTSGTCTLTTNSTNNNSLTIRADCNGTALTTANITVEYTDTGNDTTNITTSVTYPNNPPVVSDHYVTLSTDYTCSYTYADADSDAEGTPEYEWYVNSAAQSLDSATMSSAGLTTDDAIYCTVAVTDGYNTTLSTSSVYTVDDDTAPTIQAFTVASTVTFGSTYDITLVCTDDGTLALGYPHVRFDTPSGTTDNLTMTGGSSDTYTLTYNPTEEGYYGNYTVTCMDGNQNTANQTFSFTTRVSTVTGGGGGGGSLPHSYVNCENRSITEVLRDLNIEMAARWERHNHGDWSEFLDTVSNMFAWVDLQVQRAFGVQEVRDCEYLGASYKEDFITSFKLFVDEGDYDSFKEFTGKLFGFVVGREAQLITPSIDLTGEAK